MATPSTLRPGGQEPLSLTSLFLEAWLYPLWAAPMCKLNTDVKPWRQAYLLVSCQLLECHGFCSLSLRHQLRFWPKKAKVAAPKGRERGKTSYCSEVFRSSRIGDSGRCTRCQKGRGRGCSSFFPPLFQKCYFYYRNVENTVNQKKSLKLY